MCRASKTNFLLFHYNRRHTKCHIYFCLTWGLSRFCFLSLFCFHFAPSKDTRWNFAILFLKHFTRIGGRVVEWCRVLSRSILRSRLLGYISGLFWFQNTSRYSFHLLRVKHHLWLCPGKKKIFLQLNKLSLDDLSFFRLTHRKKTM